MVELFLDTSYAIALSCPSDQYHARAVALARQIEAQQRRFLTTRAVMLEIGNALAKPRYRAAAVRLLQAMEQDPAVEIVALSEERYARALRLYRERPEERGLTDCVSFVVMQERGLMEALSADEHVRQAGYRALLLDT